MKGPVAPATGPFSLARRARLAHRMGTGEDCNAQVTGMPDGDRMSTQTWEGPLE